MYSIYIVICELQEPKENYATLFSTLESFPDSFMQNQLIWFVKSNSDSKTIQERLTSHINSEDRLFIHKIVPSLSHGKMSDEFREWLKTGL